MSPQQTGWRWRVGVVLTSIAVLFLLFDSLGKLLAVRAVGWPIAVLCLIGAWRALPRPQHDRLTLALVAWFATFGDKLPAQLQVAVDNLESQLTT